MYAACPLYTNRVPHGHTEHWRFSPMGTIVAKRRTTVNMELRRCAERRTSKDRNPACALLL
jgi:hypothetical protein